MKNAIHLIFIVIAIGSISSCSDKKLNFNDKFEACLSANWKADLNLLNESFDDFIKKNYDNNVKDYIKLFQVYQFPDIEQFSSKDFEIGKQLLQNNFRENIYSVYTDTEESLEIAVPRTAGDKNQNKSRTRIEIDLNKPYLNCINNSKGTSKFLAQYVEIAGAPPAVGKLLLTQTEDPELTTELFKTIIAIEMYYMVLETVAVSPYANGLQ